MSDKTAEPIVPPVLPAFSEIYLYTIEQAAFVMGVGHRRLKEIVDTKEGPRSVPWGNERRIPGRELRRWQDAQLLSAESKVKELMARANARPGRGRSMRSAS